MDCSPPGSSFHGICQTRNWSGFPFPCPGDLPDPGIEPTSPCLLNFGQILYCWVTREAYPTPAGHQSRCSGGSSSWHRLPRWGSLTWGSNPSLTVENFCSCNYPFSDHWPGVVHLDCIASTISHKGFPVDSVVKNLPENAGDARDMSLIPRLGRYPGEGDGNPLQYSCLESSMNRRAWQAIESMGSQRPGHDWAHTQAHIITLWFILCIFNCGKCFLLVFRSFSLIVVPNSYNYGVSMSGDELSLSTVPSWPYH